MTDSLASAALARLLANGALEPKQTAGYRYWLPGFKESRYVYDDGSAIVLSSTRGPRGKKVRKTDVEAAGSYDPTAQD